ncbi:hypothetical protein LCL61_37025 [Amycolatopsis coloradensis]|uniref:Uncharacterized protein n=1 Tax=Amycolatopsis coloradensis TaxID=76021 RepID=A0ACD5BP85_9PSEU
MIGELIADSFGQLDLEHWLADDQDDWKRNAARYFEAGVSDAVTSGVATRSSLLAY